MIDGQIAAILNDRELVINVGREAGVKLGMIFRVMDDQVSVKDPRSGEILGSVRREKIRVKVVELQPRLSIARTFETYEMNVGGGNLFAQMPAPPNWVTRVRTLKHDESGVDYRPSGQDSGFVKVGDPVELVETPTPPSRVEVAGVSG